MNKPSLSWWCGWQGSDGFQQHYESHLLEVQFVCMDTEVLKAKCFTVLGWTLLMLQGFSVREGRELISTGINVLQWFYSHKKLKAEPRNGTLSWLKNHPSSPPQTPAQEINDIVIEVTEFQLQQGDCPWGLQKMELQSSAFRHCLETGLRGLKGRASFLGTFSEGCMFLLFSPWLLQVHLCSL